MSGRADPRVGVARFSRRAPRTERRPFVPLFACISVRVWYFSSLDAVFGYPRIAGPSQVLADPYFLRRCTHPSIHSFFFFFGGGIQMFARELPGHRNAISSVDTNSTNGNIVTLAGSELRVWTVNGRLLASCSVTALRRGAPPTCGVSTACPDWQVRGRAK